MMLIHIVNEFYLTNKSMFTYLDRLDQLGS